MNNKLIISMMIMISIIFIMCAGGNNQLQHEQIGENEICGDSKDAIECLIINNNRIPAFYTEFDMRYMGGGEDQTLSGKAYVDSKSGKYLIELSTMDIMVFKASVINDDIKILYRTDTDTFEAIVGNLSKLELREYTNLDFDVDTILKILSLKIPILENYDSKVMEYKEEKQQYTMTKGNTTDIITFYKDIPKVEYLIRAIKNNKKEIVSAFSYKYFDRAYKKVTYKNSAFYFSQKVSLKYYFMNESGKKEERSIVLGLRNNTTFADSFNEEVYNFDIPVGVKIHRDSNF